MSHHTARLLAIASFVVFVFAVGGASAATAAPLKVTSPGLGAAARFAVLAGSLISNVPTSAITGDVGLSPATGAGIAGFTCPQVTGSIYSVDIFPALACRITDPGLLTTAKSDLGTAYDGLAAGDNAACTKDYGVGPQDLTLVSPLGPGVYCVGAGGFLLTKNLTLSGSGVWIFRSAATIITSPGSSVTGGDPCNVWWRAATSATLDTTTSFVGNILALASITINTGASLAGRALARNAAVTLQSNTITRPTCAAAVGTSTPTHVPANTPLPPAPVERDSTNTPRPNAPTATFTASSTPGLPTPTATPPLTLPRTGSSAGQDATPLIGIGLAGLLLLAIYAGLHVQAHRSRRD